MKYLLVICLLFVVGCAKKDLRKDAYNVAYIALNKAEAGVIAPDYAVSDTEALSIPGNLDNETSVFVRMNVKSAAGKAGVAVVRLSRKDKAADWVADAPAVSY